MKERLKNQSNHAALIPAHPLDNPCFSYGTSVHCLLSLVNVLIYDIGGGCKTSSSNSLDETLTQSNATYSCACFYPYVLNL